VWAYSTSLLLVAQTAAQSREQIGGWWSIIFALWICVFPIILVIGTTAYFISSAKRRAAELRELNEIWFRVSGRFAAAPHHPQAQQDLAGFVQSHTRFAEPAYQLALQAVEQNSDSTAISVFALEAGRFACSVARFGEVTVYDEQMIQNDIAVRTR